MTGAAVLWFQAWGGAVLIGALLDLVFGDPRWLPHPVVLMGKCISGLEGLLRRVFPKTPAGEIRAGAVMALILPAGTLVVSALAVWAAGLIHPLAGLALQCFWCAQCLAAKDLKIEAMRVWRRLAKFHDLPGARKAVSRIVGRDTEELPAEGVTKAAVETVAENLSDGVIAPLFYMILGGAPLALMYKSINTMDSMCGYKSERYLYYGRAAAKLDDAANFLPSRISALLLIAASAVCGGNPADAWKIWRRDAGKSPSPNSGQTEAACAGALGIQLGGPASYFGVRYEKETMGDPGRPAEAEDIRRACRMMLTASALGTVLMVAVRAYVVWRFLG